METPCRKTRLSLEYLVLAARYFGVLSQLPVQWHESSVELQGAQGSPFKDEKEVEAGGCREVNLSKVIQL